MRQEGLLMAVMIVILMCVPAYAQVDDICKEFGFMVTLEAPRLTAPFVYGRIAVVSREANARFPKVTVNYSSRSQSPSRVTVGRSGSYCFRSTAGSGGTLTIHIDGIEVARRDVPDFGPAQKREDFQVSVPIQDQVQGPPSVVATKFSYPPNDKTIGLYRKATQLEKEKDLAGAIDQVKKIVAVDPRDFVAWTYLGNLQFEGERLEDADASYRKSLTLREDYAPAWVNVGKLRVAQKQVTAAIEIFKHAAALEPQDAHIFRLLGEAYLQNKQGTLGAQALNHAIRLDPIGQAECHLQLAHLFQLAGAKGMAAAEYRKFLAKVPDHADKRKLEQFILENR